MKKEFTKPTGEKATTGAMATTTIDMAKTKKDDESKFVTLDGFAESGKSNNFPKYVQGKKPLATGDVVSNLVKKCDKFILHNLEGEPKSSDKTREDKGYINLSFADFSAISMTKPFAELKKYIKSFKSVTGIKIVNNAKTGKSYIVAILDLKSIVRNEKVSTLRQDLQSRLDISKIDEELLAVKSDDYDYLVVVSEEEVGVALDVRRLLLTMLKPSICVEGGRLSETLALSDVEIKGDKVIFAIKSLVAGSNKFSDTISCKQGEIVCVNISLSEERFRRLVEEKMSTLSSSFRAVKTVRTVDIINSMSIPTKEINYLLGITAQTAVNYAPLLELDGKAYQKATTTNNMFLQSLSMSKTYDNDAIYKAYKEVLDKDMLHISKVGSMSGDRIYLLPNLRKLGAYVLFDSKVDTTHFKSSVTTTMNTISFVFIV